ncbi:zf-HC2 domain-containing protein [Gordonia rhizosphera]|uniref:zf-HC2 domain-containing protein n=1 Tax=Gordonia rhizosphera TaxID=83341 RepID=UPI000A0337D9|nr:zf-HC2 domain-containing protein [Gordonia rhizosphera]
MRCEVAREALSARLDGEYEGVPAARVDEHLEECSECCAWYIRADTQASSLGALGGTRSDDLTASILAGVGVNPVSRAVQTRELLRRNLVRAGLTMSGCGQIGVAMAQMAGYDFGMSPTSAGHVLNETTAWAMALGVGMIVAAWWRPARAGLLVVLAVFTAVLAGYVVHDAVTDTITAARIASHLPVLLGLVFAALSVRRPGDDSPTTIGAADARHGQAGAVVSHHPAA